MKTGNSKVLVELDMKELTVAYILMKQGVKALKETKELDKNGYDKNVINSLLTTFNNNIISLMKYEEVVTSEHAKGMYIKSKSKSANTTKLINNTRNKYKKEVGVDEKKM